MLLMRLLYMPIKSIFSILIGALNVVVWEAIIIFTTRLHPVRISFRFPILGDPGASSRNEAIFSGESLFQAKKYTFARKLDRVVTRLAAHGSPRMFVSQHRREKVCDVVVLSTVHVSLYRINIIKRGFLLFKYIESTLHQVKWK